MRAPPIGAAPACWRCALPGRRFAQGYQPGGVLMPHIAVARLHYATNSFGPRPARLEDFHAAEWQSGADALAAAQGSSSALGGVDSFLSGTRGWRATVLRCAHALPAGPLGMEMLEQWLLEVEAGLSRRGFDGVYLSLHGACMAEHEPEADLAILRRLRAVLGPRIPMVASFAAEANLSSQMIGLLDGAAVAGPGPQPTEAAAAQRALALLARAIAGRRPEGALIKRPMLLHGTALHDPDGGMAALVDALRKAEDAEGVLDVSFAAGFAWADSPAAGAGMMVWADAFEQAHAVARGLAQVLDRQANSLVPGLLAPGRAVRQALLEEGATTLLDTADDPLAGGLCDATGLLAEWLAHDAAPSVPALFAALHDPGTVAAARQAGIGATLDVALGGRETARLGQPVVSRGPLAFRGKVEHLSHGHFLAEAPALRGQAVDLGPSCVLRHGETRVLLTSRRQVVADPACLSLLRLSPAAMRVVMVKAQSNSMLPERPSIAVAAGGVAEGDFAALPYRQVPWKRH